MSDNLYAGVSVQVYPSGDATLSTPHSDVGAFLDYVRQFNSVNFHAKDDDVREWRFNAEYDNWQDSLGMDSVKAVELTGDADAAGPGPRRCACGCAAPAPTTKPRPKRRSPPPWAATC